MKSVSSKTAAIKSYRSNEYVQNPCESHELKEADFLTLNELCQELSISPATGKNWIKLNKILPSAVLNEMFYFTKEYVAQLKFSIEHGSNDALKSRRNKKFVSGNSIYKSYLSPSSSNTQSVLAVLDMLVELQFTKNLLQLLLVECALQLLSQSKGSPAMGNCLEAYTNHFFPSDVRYQLIEDLFPTGINLSDFLTQYQALFQITYHYEPGEDVLGLLYLSLENIGSRKAAGAYYTPTYVVHQLIEHLDLDGGKTGKTVLDPCCGTGNFLLQLPDYFVPENIYGNDIDPISILLTRINLSLRFPALKIDILYQHITVSDYLFNKDTAVYDFIIGNPPWGCEFTPKQKTSLRMSYSCAIGENIESYDLFIERSLAHLSLNGILSFVLPEAILNVKSHGMIRKEILLGNSIQRLSYLGDVFDHVQCPCIILQLLHTKKPFSCLGMQVQHKQNTFEIKQERPITADCFSFLSTDAEYDILHKLFHNPNFVTLLNHADFALGIVTGNNKKYISSVSSLNSERILKGSDICKFQKKQTSNYIDFVPQQFQQVAPISYYRAPEKLLYRFICNQLVFAYDNQQTLSLNSCNILIPKLDGLSIKYILAVLNSRVSQFLFHKQFHSIKVLRSHIEQLPIPVISLDKQQDIIALADQLAIPGNDTQRMTLYNLLDMKIANIFQLSKEEYRIIQSACMSKNLFL
ncbi:MAG: TaqI-like C-terminal specificity domain-containing protein [Lachnospiraceae bacterium]